MNKVLEVLFDQSEKVLAWAAMVVLAVAITSMASCTQNADNNRHKTESKSKSKRRNG